MIEKMDKKGNLGTSKGINGALGSVGKFRYPCFLLTKGFGKLKLGLFSQGKEKKYEATQF